MFILELSDGLFKKKNMLGSIGDTFIKPSINTVVSVFTNESSSQISKNLY